MKPLIVANWKMNPVTMKKAEELFNSVKHGVKDIENAETVICPPFIYLPLLKGLILGAQDCYWEEKGAYTGEVSVAMLKEMGCKYVIIGHSERRKIFNETNENVNKKLKAVLETGLIPIMCIGETEGEREMDKTEEVLEKEIKQGLNGVDVSKIIIAYEPIWAIGTGNPCDIEEAQRMKEIIQKMVSKDIRILYGGSVKANNAEGYLKQAGFNGLLVGGASLDAKEFVEIVNNS
ncbi:triose-phosphate isomerase [Patescibacteria group bacterium]|nr:triose-phosphate isomerase [Patescibacteria group bacterium]